MAGCEFIFAVRGKSRGEAMLGIKAFELKNVGFGGLVQIYTYVRIMSQFRSDSPQDCVKNLRASYMFSANMTTLSRKVKESKGMGLW